MRDLNLVGKKQVRGQAFYLNLSVFDDVSHAWDRMTVLKSAISAPDNLILSPATCTHKSMNRIYNPFTCKPYFHLLSVLFGYHFYPFISEQTMIIR